MAGPLRRAIHARTGPAAGVDDARVNVGLATDGARVSKHAGDRVHYLNDTLCRNLLRAFASPRSVRPGRRLLPIDLAERSKRQHRSRPRAEVLRRKVLA